MNRWRYDPNLLFKTDLHSQYDQEVIYPEVIYEDIEHLIFKFFIAVSCDVSKRPNL